MTRRTIYDMTDEEALRLFRTELYKIPGGIEINDACIIVTRRIAGPDPRPLVEALQECVNRLKLCAITVGNDPEMAALSVAKYREVLSAWKNAQ
jgi:hypothetical protein